MITFNSFGKKKLKEISLVSSDKQFDSISTSNDLKFELLDRHGGNSAGRENPGGGIPGTSRPGVEHSLPHL